MEESIVRKWQLQEAKAKFSEFLNASLSEGPQIVTKRGVETAVLVRIDLWQQLQAGQIPSLKDLLLAPEPRTEDLVPARGDRLHRPPPTFD